MRTFDKLVIKCLCVDWSFVIKMINLQKHSFVENIPRYVIFSTTYPFSMISIQSFRIDNGLSDTVDIIS